MRHTIWDSGGGEAGAELWTHLRLLFWCVVWHLRCCRAAEGQVFTAAAVVALVKSWVQRAISSMLSDWTGCALLLTGAVDFSAYLAAVSTHALTCRRRILRSAGALAVCLAHAVHGCS